MAAEGAHRIRKDFKFEIFLKRSLDPDEFERVRFYDFCVVTSRTEDRAYKYVVLTDEWIYLTESPPKTITRAVHLRDVEGIEWMRDFPDFLDGELKKNAQHLCVRYRLEEPARKGRKENGKAGELEGSLTARSARSDLNATDSSAALASARPEDRQSGVVPRLRFEEEAEEVVEGPADTRTAPEHVPEVAPSRGCCRCAPKDPAVPPAEVTTANGSAEGDTEDADALTARPRPLDLPAATPRPSFRETARSARSPRSKPASLHLYLLNGDTPALLLFCTAWNTFMLRGTRLLDGSYGLRCTPRGKLLQDEALAVLFAKLRAELLESGPFLDDCFDLTNELFNATRRNFGLKKLFWRTPDLFVFLVGRLKAFLPKTQTNMREASGRFDRADEIDFCLLVLDTLNLMLQETETMASRNNCLRYRNGNECLELVGLLTGEIALPGEHQAMSAAASKLLNMRETELALKKLDKEFEKLTREFVSVGAAILYELLLTGRTASEGPKDSLPTESQLVRRVEQSPNVLAFVKALVEHTIHLIAPSHLKKAHLSPMQAVEAFQQFSVLHSLAALSHALKQQMREEYMEEFRYFVQAPVVLQKLCRHYPITWPTLNVIEEVTALVTRRKRLFDAEDDREAGMDGEEACDL